MGRSQRARLAVRYPNLEYSYITINISLIPVEDMRVSHPISPPSLLDDATISCREVLSGVSGFISLAAWIFLLVGNHAPIFRVGG